MKRTDPFDADRSLSTGKRLTAACPATRMPATGSSRATSASACPVACPAPPLPIPLVLRSPCAASRQVGSPPSQAFLNAAPNPSTALFLSTCLQVNGDATTWAVGKLLVLDTSFLHATWNHHPTQARVIFFFDFFHPDLSAQVATRAAAAPRPNAQTTSTHAPFGVLCVFIFVPAHVFPRAHALQWRPLRFQERRALTIFHALFDSHARRHERSRAAAAAQLSSLFGLSAEATPDATSEETGAPACKDATDRRGLDTT